MEPERARPPEPHRVRPTLVGLVVVLAATVALALALAVGHGGVGAQDRAQPAPASWLEEVNLLRALAGLPPVAEVAEWSAGARDHARWMVLNDTISHDPPPGTDGWTPAGAAAAARANLTVSSHPWTDVEAVDTLMSVPFHGIAVIDPLLTRSGFGSFHDPSAPGLYRWAAALDVLSDLEAPSPRPAVEHPVTWPTEGSTLHLTTYLGPEVPDPLAHCPGYVDPVGVPLYALFGPGAGTTSSVSLTRAPDGAPVEVCWFDDATYQNPDGGHRDLGRAVLASRQAVVALPRHPLAVGERYRFEVVRGGVVAASTFDVGTEGVPGRFWDVPASSPFSGAIAWLVSEGIADGYPDWSFRPTAGVSRQAVAAYLHRAAGSPPPAVDDPGFVDVPVGHPFHGPVTWMAGEGYAGGYSDGAFRPTGAVTRQAVAAYLHRFAGSPPPGLPAGFVDVPVGHPFHDAIAWMVGEGITEGYGDGTFQPSGPVSRQAVAAFLQRAAGASGRT